MKKKAAKRSPELLCIKHRYASVAKATAALVEIQRLITLQNKLYGEHKKLPRRAYYCVLCGFFHLTSQSRKPRQAIEAEPRYTFNHLYVEEQTKLPGFEKMRRRKKHRKRRKIVRCDNQSCEE